ncbi:MAG: CBS domain-containing protein, partial [Spirochaetaceae bacterium]
MTKAELKDVLIDRNRSVKDAMKQLEANSKKTLFAVDHENGLYGSLVDGDIRRWILDSGSLSATVGAVCNREPLVVGTPYRIDAVKRLMIDNNITSVPVVNGSKQLEDVLTWEAVFGGTVESSPPTQLDIPVVIMAGGKGSRLDPFTKILPKPLIPVGEKTALEFIIDSFRPHGIQHFYLSVFHKAKIIKAYFEDLAPEYTIEYLEEDRPLGTGGGLKLLYGRIDGTFIVTNCDNIIRLDYANLVAHHREHGNHITVVASMKNYDIPYGICEIENGGTLTNMVEKPEYSFLVNTGMYVLESSVLELIPDQQLFHLTHLIQAVRNNG